MVRNHFGSRNAIKKARASIGKGTIHINMVAKRVTEEIHLKAMAAAEEAKEAVEKLEEELAYMLEKAEQEKTETALKYYFEGARYLQGKKDEWMRGCWTY